MIALASITFLFLYTVRNWGKDKREIRTYYASSCDGCERDFPTQKIENHKEGDKILCGECVEFKNRKKNNII